MVRWQGSAVPIGTGHPEVVECASAGWSDAMRGDGGVLGGSGSVGLRRQRVGGGPVGLDLHARFGQGGWGVLGLGGWGG